MLNKITETRMKVEVNSLLCPAVGCWSLDTSLSDLLVMKKQMAKVAPIGDFRWLPRYKQEVILCTLTVPAATSQGSMSCGFLIKCLKLTDKCLKMYYC
jgi:hypothetical protein